MAGQWPEARFELFGSDLSERALEKAQTGLYTQFEVQRGLPIRSLVRHFEKVDEMWAISPQIRQAIRWRRLNLIGDMSRVRGFDLVFCRNVIGSMIEPAQRQVVENLAAALNPGGKVLFGSGEDPVAGAEPLVPVDDAPGLYALRSADRAAA